VLGERSLTSLSNSESMFCVECSSRVNQVSWSAIMGTTRAEVKGPKT
jgi:hypothetical protein